MYYGSLLSQWHNRLRIGPALPFTLVYSQLMLLVHNTIRYTCSSPTCREMYTLYTCTCWMYIHVHQGFICGGFIFGGLFKSRSCTLHIHILVLCCVSQASMEEKAYHLLREWRNRKQRTVYALRTILTQAGVSLDTSTPQKAAQPPNVPSSQPASKSIIHMCMYIVQHVHTCTCMYM